MEFSKAQTARATSDSQAAISAGAVVDGTLVALVRRYLRTWGLSDRSVADFAARRLVGHAALTPGTNSDLDPKKSLVALTRRWVEAFAREETDSGDWFWRAQTLLARYPHTFLETPIPEAARESQAPNLLPQPVPRLMIQQQITDSFERLKGAFRDAKERLRGEELGPDSRPLIEPSL